MTESPDRNSMLPPALMVHGLADLRRALAPGLPVTLLSAPGAALSWGCSWWRDLLALEPHSGPALLDCAAAPGRAAEALAIGLTGLVLAPCPAWGEIAALAAQSGALLLPAPPPSLDVRFLDRRLNGGERRLISWLGG